jgi:hypothetical protein
MRRARKQGEVANRGFTGAEYIATNFIASVSYDCKVRTVRAAEGPCPAYIHVAQALTVVSKVVEVG